MHTGEESIKINIENRDAVEKRCMTCINEAVVEMETEQGRPLAGFALHCRVHCRFYYGKCIRACFVVKIWA